MTAKKIISVLRNIYVCASKIKKYFVDYSATRIFFIIFRIYDMSFTAPVDKTIVENNQRRKNKLFCLFRGHRYPISLLWEENHRQ
jgi:hypothetical protein